MTEKQLLEKMIRFELWIEPRQLDMVQSVLERDSRPLDLLTHILVSQAIWLNRLEGRAGEEDWFPEAGLEQCRLLAKIVEERWGAFLKKLTAKKLEERITVKRPDGAVIQPQVRDILLQLVTHSAHHRGQMNLLVKEAGGEPSKDGYIRYTLSEQ